MGLFTQLLLFLHFAGLAMGAASTISSFVMSRMAAPAGAAPAGLPPSARIMSTIGRAGLGILLVTGGLMLWLRYSGGAGLNHWFSLKMVFVVLTIIGVIVLGITARRAGQGDVAARSRLPTVSMLTLIALVGVVFSAVMAFN